MPRKITDQMIHTAGGSFTIDTISKIRRLLAAAGVDDLELHRVEIEALVSHREKAKSHRLAAERYLAAGPLPQHTCERRRIEGGELEVEHHNDCPFGCRPGYPRIEVEPDA